MLLDKMDIGVNEIRVPHGTVEKKMTWMSITEMYKHIYSMSAHMCYLVITSSVPKYVTL